MVAVLIDLHVRPVWTEDGDADVELLLVQARDHGLDAVVVAVPDGVVELPDAAEVIAATGVQVFHAVELPTDAGTMLCYPRQLDAWFQGAAWRALPRLADSELYAADEVVQAFVQRGGAVIAVGNTLQPLPAGITAQVLVGGDPSMRAEEDRLPVGPGGRLAGVGASGSSPGQPGFGCAATVFACPPTGQESLVEGLRSGRMWPASIGPVPVVERGVSSPAEARSPRADQEGGETAARQPEGRQGSQRQHREDRAKVGREPQVAAEAQPGRDATVREAPPVSARDHAGATREPAGGRGAKVVKKPSRYDVMERPGDNRGNRLNRDEVLRTLLWVPASEEDQPSLDPVALMYGLDTKKQMRWRDKSDVDLDRNVNGNRNKGPDPNIMAHPQFEDMRQERLQLSLLFAQTEERNDLQESVALRFALSQLRRNEDGLPVLNSGPNRGRSGPRHQGHAGNGNGNGGGGNGGNGQGRGNRRRR